MKKTQKMKIDKKSKIEKNKKTKNKKARKKTRKRQEKSKTKQDDVIWISLPRWSFFLLTPPTGFSRLAATGRLRRPGGRRRSQSLARVGAAGALIVAS